MLKPEYFNDKADRMIELYRQLEDYIFKDIAYRLLKSQSVSGTADRLIWKLEQMGESRAEIMNKLSKLTGLSKRELKELLQDAVITSWNDDLSTFNQMGINIVNPLENQAVMSVMNAEYQKCQGELDNLTRTTMNQAQVDLTRMLDEAEMRVASGVQSYSSAVCEILDNYAKKGMVVEYPTGTHRSLEAAVRCCVVTSMNQTSAQITNQYILEGGIEYVLVSAHLGARIQQPGQPYLAGHENWQGKVYRIRGSEPGYPNLLEMTGYDIGENGAGKVVNPLGLHGYNCRHSHQPWDKALKNPYVDENGKSTIDTEESRKLYQNQQKQRAMERSIRATKRRLLMKQQEIDLVAETDVKEILQNDYDKLAYKLREQNKLYNEFCAENDLQKQSDRLKVAGYKREQAAKANGRARAFSSKSNENIRKSGAVYSYKNDPDGSKRQDIAEKLYEQTRNRNSVYEVRAIAKHSGMPEADIKKVYDHIYTNKHLFKNGTIHLFDPDYEMAQSWQRLRNNNNIQPHDITLLKHELAEYNIMGESIDIEYEPVHNEVTKKYNYQKELMQYLKERGRE
ncbi:phage capsid protein [Roseburia sp. AF34-16]|uniref:phage minor capsid protein n=1 Tax=Roseburia sp. AF34-16 TaxID=2293136 RepID=UPI000E4E3D5A|nr:phage minor capsid protein [Roseburia sp. AF34-16]RGF60633.1 phage capsid protein [Roseburia sp. AF34-16]